MKRLTLKNAAYWSELLLKSFFKDSFASSFIEIGSFGNFTVYEVLSSHPFYEDFRDNYSNLFDVHFLVSVHCDSYYVRIIYNTAGNKTCHHTIASCFNLNMELKNTNHKYFYL